MLEAGLGGVRRLFFGRTAERTEYVIRVPMELMAITSPGPIDFRRWSRCQVVYPDGPGGERRAQGHEELTVLMTRR